MKGIGDSVEAAAAFWFARLRSNSAGRSDRARFIRWLNADPVHREAYVEYENFWEAIGGAAADPEMVELRRQALSAEPESRQLHWHVLGAIAATLVILFLAGGLLLNRPGLAVHSDGAARQVATATGTQLLETTIGQRSSVTLDDGSVVELNTDSRVEVDYGDNVRQIRLIRGQALFEVAHDKARPFVVHAADQRIVALGTAFDVKLEPEGVRVTLVEGQVAVEPVGRRAAAERRMLAPGDQLVARPDQPVVILAANIGEAVSWRTGRLIFSDDPLGEVVDEINRYSSRKIVLGDPSLADLRVSGVFKAGSVGNFVAAMEAAFPVEAAPDGEKVALHWK